MIDQDTLVEELKHHGTTGDVDLDNVKSVKAYVAVFFEVEDEDGNSEKGMVARCEPESIGEMSSDEMWEEAPSVVIGMGAIRNFAEKVRAINEEAEESKK